MTWFTLVPLAVATLHRIINSHTIDPQCGSSRSPRTYYSGSHTDPTYINHTYRTHTPRVGSVYGAHCRTATSGREPSVSTHPGPLPARYGYTCTPCSGPSGWPVTRQPACTRCSLHCHGSHQDPSRLKQKQVTWFVFDCL